MIFINVIAISRKNEIFSMLYKLDPCPMCVYFSLIRHYKEFHPDIRVLAAFEVFDSHDSIIQFLEDHYRTELITA